MLTLFPLTLIRVTRLLCKADKESKPAFPMKHSFAEVLHSTLWKQQRIKRGEQLVFPLAVSAFCVTPARLPGGARSGALPAHRRRDSTLLGASPPSPRPHGAGTALAPAPQQRLPAAPSRAAGQLQGDQHRRGDLGKREGFHKRVAQLGFASPAELPEKPAPKTQEAAGRR